MNKINKSFSESPKAARLTLAEVAKVVAAAKAADAAQWAAKIENLKAHFAR